MGGFESKAAQGPLARRIVAAPQLYAPDAHARVADWLGEIAETPAGAALAQLFGQHPTLAALIAGLAEGSPDLWDRVRGSPERLLALLDAEPELRFDDIIADAKRVIAATRDEAEVMRLLRHMKAEAALLIALADIGGVWPVTQVVDLQTMLADAAVGAAVDYLLEAAQRSGKLKGFERGRPAQGSGYIVLAM